MSGIVKSICVGTTWVFVKKKKLYKPANWLLCNIYMSLLRYKLTKAK